MKKKLLLLYFFSLLTTVLLAQKSTQILVSIDDQPISVAEFEAALNKDGLHKSKEEIKEFLNTYINYRLNVLEGRAEQLDTTEQYRRELKSSKILITQSFTKDTVRRIIPYLERLYNKMQQNVELNHTVLKFENDIYFPSDTLALYNKALEMRTKLLKEGFGQNENATEEQLQIKQIDVENIDGYLGFINLSSLSPQVADVAINIPINQISMPIRTSDGYHILQVLDRRAYDEEYAIDMIPFFFPSQASEWQRDSLKKEVEDIYKEVVANNAFDGLCEAYLEALHDGTKNCSIGYVRYNSTYPPHFTSEIFKLKKIGEISKPIELRNGYCLIRLANVRETPPFSIDQQNRLLKYIGKSKYLSEYTTAMNDVYTKQFNLQVNKDAYQQLQDIANTIYPEDTLFMKNVSNLDQELFTIDGKRVYKVRNFVRYVDSFAQMLLPDTTVNSPSMIKIQEIVKYPLSTDRLKILFDRYTASCVQMYADSTIEDRMPELKKQVQNMADDLIVYQVINSHIMQPSQNDKVNMEIYFEKNKNRFDWKDGKRRFKGLVFCSDDQGLIESTKKEIKNVNDVEEMTNIINKVVNENKGAIYVRKGVWVEGDNELVDNKIFNNKDINPEQSCRAFDVVGYFVNSPEEYTDAGVDLEVAYMQYLEEQWYKNLRTKYKVNINESALKKVK